MDKAAVTHTLLCYITWREVYMHTRAEVLEYPQAFTYIYQVVHYKTLLCDKYLPSTCFFLTQSTALPRQLRSTETMTLHDHCPNCVAGGLGGRVNNKNR